MIYDILYAIEVIVIGAHLTIVFVFIASPWVSINHIS